MSSDTITVPVSVIVFLGGIVISFLGCIFSFAVHLLIAIRSSLASLVTATAVKGAETDARLSVLERHDAANGQDTRSLVEYLLRGPDHHQHQQERNIPA